MMAICVNAAEPTGTYFRDWLLAGPIMLEGKEPVAGTCTTCADLIELPGSAGRRRNGAPHCRPAAGIPRRPDTMEGLCIPGSVDLDAALGRTDGALAYAYTAFEADSTSAAVLSLGSNDGCRVWLNGEPIFDHPGARGLVLDADQIPVLLRQGNHLLLKVEDQGNAWGFACRVLPIDQDERWKRLTLFSARQAGGRRPPWTSWPNVCPGYPA